MSSWHPQAIPRAMKKGALPHHIARKGSADFCCRRAKEGGKPLTNGGRGLQLRKLRTPLPEAIAKSYEAVKTVKFAITLSIETILGKKLLRRRCMKWFIESMLKKSRV